MNKEISSLQNPLIKQLIKLQNKSRERKKTGLFVVEGLREINLAIVGGYSIKQIFYVSKIIELKELVKTITNPSIDFIEITQEIYQKLAYRNSTEGVIAMVKTKNHSIENLIINNINPLILVAESPEKPGNIGAILRTADAANVDAVLIANSTTDLYNPNIIRSSVGCIFTNQIATGSSTEIISYLKKKNIAIYCAALKNNALVYHTQDFKKSTAIVVGTEATGLSNEWLKNATQSIIIPMQGKIDSMNVSVAAGILIFEANRQRNQ